jgi:predicted DNA-binding transcriptional regulator YafY
MTLLYGKEDGSVTVRKVEPYGVEIAADGATYMRAMDRRTDEPRCFRLDRIHGYSLHYKTGRHLVNNPYV